MSDGRLVMLDLFCGINGASMAMRERPARWRVIGVDREHVNRRENFSNRKVRDPEIVADVMALPFETDTLPPIDFLWASPPCTYYSRYHKKCWYPNEPEPDHTLYDVTRAIIHIVKPRFWAIENVVGAQTFWGKATVHFGPIYVWTNVPVVAFHTYVGKTKVAKWSRDKYLAAETPLVVSKAFADTIERADVRAIEIFPVYVGKQYMSGRDKYLRSETPKEVSVAFADGVETMLYPTITGSAQASRVPCALGADGG